MNSRQNSVLIILGSLLAAGLFFLVYKKGSETPITVDGRVVSHEERKLQAVQPNDLIVIVWGEEPEMPSVLRVNSFVPQGAISYIQFDHVAGNFLKSVHSRDRQIRIKDLLDLEKKGQNKVYLISRDSAVEFYGRVGGLSKSLGK